MRAFATALILAVSALGGFAVGATKAAAQEREVLGYGRLFNNDWFGDNKDRWRTGSYVISQVRGPEWAGLRPDRPFVLNDVRLRSEIIAPSKLSNPDNGDRRYVGALSFGLHTHFNWRDLEVSAGADAVIIGPQTGLGEFQEKMHEVLSAPRPSVTDNQIGNQVRLGGTLELARPYRISETMTLRPYIEAQAGVEDILRIGGDLVVGTLAQNDLLLRDSVTGHLYRGTTGSFGGLALVMGGDLGMVGDSAFLPEDLGYTPEDRRARLRGGLHWQLSPEGSFFYGLTYLSEEFEGQPEGQVVGSIKVDFSF